MLSNLKIDFGDQCDEFKNFIEKKSKLQNEIMRKRSHNNDSFEASVNSRISFNENNIKTDGDMSSLTQWSFFGQKTPFARCKKSLIALRPLRVDVVPDWTLVSLFVCLKYSD